MIAPLPANSVGENWLAEYCDYLKDKLVVDSSGHVIPCCILPKDIRSVNGNAIKEDFEEIYSSQKMKEDPIFYWLQKGHRAMREVLGFEKLSNNLCSICIEMLTILKDKKFNKSRRNTSKNSLWSWNLLKQFKL